MKKSVFNLLTSLSLLIILAVLLMSCSAATQQPLGLIDGHLASCPNSPNCVSSEIKTSVAFVEPLTVLVSAQDAWQCLKRSINKMGGTIEQDDNHYLWATFKTKLFRFVDDVELRLDTDNKLIHVRSASRVGYSDLGVNSKRVEVLREKFMQEQELIQNP